MTGEITIMGKVIGIGGVQPKLMAAIEAGIKTVIMPQENEKDVQHLPEYIKDKIAIRYVTNIQEVLDIALLE